MALRLPVVPFSQVHVPVLRNDGGFASDCSSPPSLSDGGCCCGASSRSSKTTRVSSAITPAQRSFFSLTSRCFDYRLRRQQQSFMGCTFEAAAAELREEEGEERILEVKHDSLSTRSKRRAAASSTVKVSSYGVKLGTEHHARSAATARGGSSRARRKCTRVSASVSSSSSENGHGDNSAERDVLAALAQIIDPDFGTDIVSCGFVKDLQVDETTGEVSFRLELTTPACPVKDEFERQAKENVSTIAWVKQVNVTMSASPPKPLIADNVPSGLRQVSNIIAVSSCKGGVGKSTVAVNLAYSLAMMGARVGIFDADIYGPSLPTMVSPELRVLQMDPETKAIFPTEFEGVKLVSFGFAGQGSAIMRGPMVSGVINQMLTSTVWGELDYLVIDMPPGTGDIQLTLCQVVPLTAAVIVTTPQKLAFIDVAKGVRMFAALKVPCIAVVENMCYFEADGKRYFPFGKGSGEEVASMFGIPHLAQMPIRAELSASGDSGRPEVIADPTGEIALAFQEIGVAVVQECAKFRKQVAMAVQYNSELRAIVVKPPGADEEFYLHPATVRRNDRSARSVDEWTGEQRLRYSDVMDNVEPLSIRPMGNYAVSISWPDGLTQVAPFEQLEQLERLLDPYVARSEVQKKEGEGEGEGGQAGGGAEVAFPKQPARPETPPRSGAAAILQHATSLSARRASESS